MCDDKNLFGDLEDDNWDEPGVATSSEHTVAVPEVTLFSEPCSKCRGTGTWRPGYRCFKCKGTGKLSFKTSPEMRARGRKSAAKSKATKAEANHEQFKAWAAKRGMTQWFADNATNGFAQSLYQGGMKYGHLTEGQEQAVYKAMAKDDDAAGGASEWIKSHADEHAWLVREADAGNEFAESLLNGQWGLMKKGLLSDNQVAAIRKNITKDGGGNDSELDISGLKGYYAVPDGDTRLKLCVRRPGKNSRYLGWTFVDDGAAYGERKTYGKQAPEGSYQGDVQEALAAILADPFAAQVAYGKLTGTCGTCGRILEDEASVAAGIGPICAAKFS